MEYLISLTEFTENGRPFIYTPNVIPAHYQILDPDSPAALTSEHYAVLVRYPGLVTELMYKNIPGHGAVIFTAKQGLLNILSILTGKGNQVVQFAEMAVNHPQGHGVYDSIIISLLAEEHPSITMKVKRALFNALFTLGRICLTRFRFKHNAGFVVRAEYNPATAQLALYTPTQVIRGTAGTFYTLPLRG